MKQGFVIDSLPRCGSTTLANLLNSHPEIQCLIEPFHPRRYDGQFHQMALQAGSVAPALNLIWHRWSGIKHVWDAARGFPFPQNPELNDGIVVAADKVVFLERRNLLRRYVSGIISQQLDFWIGTREQFYARLESVQLRELDAATVLQEIQKDRAALARRLQFMREQNCRVLRLFYEDIFGDSATASRQFQIMNDILDFLGHSAISETTFHRECAPLLDKDKYQWASPEIYRLIPRIKDLEREIGSDQIGWLF